MDAGKTAILLSLLLDYVIAFIRFSTFFPFFFSSLLDLSYFDTQFGFVKLDFGLLRTDTELVTDIIFVSSMTQIKETE